jgi:glycosyltransferase involved in cell wall biosynthesis
VSASSHQAASLPRLTYLTVDSIATGVGTSQVLPYVTRLAQRGLEVTLHTFERGQPPPTLSAQVRQIGVDWRPHRFRGNGTAGGFARVLEGAAAIRGEQLVHCRSDLPAASALLARVPTWVWDVRSFWVDQRIALGAVRPGSGVEQVLRRVERAAATRAAAVTTLTDAAVAELGRRHPRFDPGRATVVPTCVDLRRFTPAPLPPREPLVVLLSGTFNALYDLAAGQQLVEHLRRHLRCEVRHARDLPFDAMPAQVEAAHVGLSILRVDCPAASQAAAPTKVAEFLACGRPVVVNAGLGDFGELLPSYRAGVVLDGTSDAALQRGAEALLGLLADPDTPARCRRLAAEHFDLDEAVDRLLATYHRAQTVCC